jgi:hypothetical protein
MWPRLVEYINHERPCGRSTSLSGVDVRAGAEG